MSIKKMEVWGQSSRGETKRCKRMREKLKTGFVDILKDMRVVGAVEFAENRLRWCDGCSAEQPKEEHNGQLVAQQILIVNQILTK